MNDGEVPDTANTFSPNKGKVFTPCAIYKVLGFLALYRRIVNVVLKDKLITGPFCAMIMMKKVGTAVG